MLILKKIKAHNDSDNIMIAIMNSARVMILNATNNITEIFQINASNLFDVKPSISSTIITTI